MTRHSPELAESVAAAAEATGREPEVLAEEILEAGVQRYNEKLSFLRAELARADASSDAAPGVFNRVRERFGLPTR